jgi:hypothetical protein
LQASAWQFVTPPTAPPAPPPEVLFMQYVIAV